jgi:hypothetical protein
MKWGFAWLLLVLGPDGEPVRTVQAELEPIRAYGIRFETQRECESELSRRMDQAAELIYQAHRKLHSEITMWFNEGGCSQ